MASELQLKLFRENKRFIELAETMAQVVYPKLIYLLEQLCQQRAYFDSVKHIKDFYFDLEKGFYFYNKKTTKEGEIVEDDNKFNIPVLGINICHIFEVINSEEVDIKDIKNSVAKRYTDFCDEVLKQINILEQELEKVNNTLINAQNIKLPLERKTIFEKTLK